jgi:hypothetical protein
MKSALLTALTLLLYIAHQDFWFWRTAKPFVFGFLPIGLFYHAAYCLVASLWMIVLIRTVWPSQLERDSEPKPEESAR